MPSEQEERGRNHQPTAGILHRVATLGVFSFIVGLLTILFSGGASPLMKYGVAFGVLGIVFLGIVLLVGTVTDLVRGYYAK